MLLKDTLEWRERLQNEYVNDEKININLVASNSRIKVNWRCEVCDGVYEASIRNRINKEYKKATHCPYCSHKKILKGFNDLESKRPKLLEYWDYKSNAFTPSEIFSKSGVRVNWKCKKYSHSFTQSPKSIKSLPDCPYCNFKKLLTGFNDLTTINSEISQYFDLEKNILSADKILYLKSTKLWWLCGEGHSTFKSIEKMISGKCKYCCNQKTLRGFNDLQSKNEELSKEWNYEKNSLKIDEVNFKSGVGVWWRCSEGHEWSATVYNRNIRGSGCPKCLTKHEIAIGEDLSKFFKSEVIRNERGVISPYEIDFYFPALKLAIEYNGDHWHSNMLIKQRGFESAGEYHQMKFNRCLTGGITLLYIWDSDWKDNKSEVVEGLEVYKNFNIISPILNKYTGARDLTI